MAVAAAPGAQAAAPSPSAPADRAAAVRIALTALKAQGNDSALTVFALRRPVPAGTSITQAGRAATASASRRVQGPAVSARLSRAGVAGVATRMALETTERSWLLYADRGPNQAYEHPGQVVLVGAQTGKVRITATLRWVPLVDGRLPAFFRSAAAYRSTDFRVFDRPWLQKTAPAAAGARPTVDPAEAAAAQKRLADAVVRDKSCALRVSDTLGDFYDFGNVDRTRAELGRVFNRLAALNPGFVTQRYTAGAGVSPTQAAQRLIAGGCADLTLYVAGSGARTGKPGIVVGVRPRRGGVQWHTLTAAAIEKLVQSHRGVTFKLVFDAPYAGRVAQQLTDEPNVSVLLTPGGADEPSFTYLPQILGSQGVIQNTSNPMGLLEFTNNIVVGIERFSGAPTEVDHAIAERAAGHSDSLMGWMLARALDLAPSLFTTQLIAAPAQRVPAASAPSVVNRAPIPATPPLATREDVAADLTLVATDAELDPITFTVTAPPAHGKLSGTPPLLRYTPDPDFNGTDGLTFRASDGHGGVAEQRVPITVASDNDASTVVGGPSGTRPTYAEQQASPSAVVVDDALTVADPDSPTLKRATVTIAAGHVAGDVLAADVPASLTTAFDAQTGVLTLTGRVSRAAYETALRSVTFRSTSDDPGTSRTIRFSVDDGDGDQVGVPADRGLDVTPVNDAPVLTRPVGTVHTDEDVPATFTAGTASALSVADPDAGAAGVEVTVTASAGTLAAGTVPASLAVTGEGTGTLTLSGPVAALDDALDGLAYTPPQDAFGPATLTVAVDDHGHTGSGGAQTDGGTIAVAVAARNDAPVLTPATGAVAYTEDGAASTLAGTLDVADVDDATLASATVRISAGRQSGDVLGFVDTAAIDGTFDAGTGTLTLVPTGASATLAQYQAALRTVTFSTTNDDPATSRTVELVADDGDDAGVAATRTVTITPANDAPQIANSGGSATVAEDDADGDVVDPALTLSDPDDSQLAAATVAITAGRETGDALTFADQNGITGGAYDAATGTLALTGAATVAQYRDALRSVRLVVGGQAPTTATRTVRFTADDGDLTATSAGRSVAVQPVNDVPVNTVPGAQAVNENATLTFGVSNAIAIADADAGSADVRVTLTATHGTLTLGGTTGLTFTTGDGTADATLTFEGTVAAANAALAGTTYAPANAYSGAASVEVSTNDLGHSGGPAETDTDTIAVQVLGLNRAPVNHLPAAQSTDEDTDLVLSAANGNALTVTDTDAGGADVQVALAVTNGVLHLAQSTGLTIAAGADGTAAVTVQGPLTAIDAALDGLRYAPTANFSGAATLSVATDDLGHTGQGGAQTDTDNLSITVAAVNDAPALTAPAAATVAEEGTATFSVANVNPILVSDLDAGAGTIAVDLTATHGTVALGGTTGVAVTGDGTSTVHVTGPRGAVNTALEGTTFTGAADYDGSAQLQVDVSDQGNTGSGGAKTDSKTVAITITAVNDAPAITAPVAVTVNKDGSRTFSAGGGNAVTVADPDAGAADVRVQLVVAHGALRLAATTGLTFTTGDGTDDPVLDFRGALADVAVALDGLRYAPDSGWSGTDSLDVDVDDLGHTGAGGAKTDSASVTLNVVDLNTAPVATVPGAQTFDEDTTLTLAAATKLAVSDADVDPATGVLEVSLGAAHGTLSLDGVAGLTFSTGDGTADAQIVVQGSPDALNAALDGAVYTPVANYYGSDTLTLEVDDLGATGAPGALQDTDTVALTITAVNDAPQLTQPDAGALTYTEDSPTEDHADAIAPNLTVADVDDANVAGATVVLATPASGDDLVFSTQNGITGSYDSGTGTLTLSGSATKANYQSALRSVKYRTTSEAPAVTQRTVTFRVDDGHALSHLSNQVTRAIDVIAVNDAPVADDETFNNASRAIGNTSLVVDGPGASTPDPSGPQKTVSGDILAGDTDADNSAAAFTVTPLSNVATTNGGRVTLEADGDFTYLPPQGCGTATDSFTYTLSDNDATSPLTDTGTVTLSIADCVWYVDASAGSQPTATGGTSQAPYNSLADLDGAAGAGDEDASGDRVFLYAGSYAGPFPLESGEQVLTQRHGLSVPDGASGTVVLHAPAAGASTITSGVTVSTNNTLEGVDFGASATTALSGTSVGALTVNKTTSGGIVNASGGGVDISGTGNALDVHLTTLSTTGGTGLSLANATGTFEATGGAITNPSGPGVSLSGGSADVTLGGTVTDNGGTFVSVANQTGGTKDFNGKLTSTGGGIGLSSNTGATMRFDGGLSLSTTTANAFSATGGGTVAVTDPASDNNVLTTTTGTPLTITSTAIHSDDLTFERIASNGAANGVLLASTGSAGGLNVTGSGGTCTAGTPTCTGGTIQSSTGAGISANDVDGGIALTRVRVINGGNDGVRFAESTGLSVDSSLVSGNGDSTQTGVTSADRERGIDVENGTGNVAVTSSQVSTSYYDNIRFDNDNGSVDFDLTGSTIAGAKNGDGVQFYGDGTAAMKADVTGSTFTTNFDDGFQLATTGGSVTPTMNLNFNTNQVSADASQVAAGALVTVSPGGNATTKVAMSGNTLNTSKGSTLILNPAGTSQFDATVLSNTVQNAGGVGIWGKPAQQAQSRMRISNNTLTEYAGQGMYLRHGEGIGGVASYVVQGNTLSTNVGQEGIFVESGTTSSGSESVSVCADIGGAGALANALGNAGGPAGGGTYFDDVAFSRYTNSTLTLPGYGGGSDPTAFVTSRNTGSPMVSNYGPQDPTGGAACQTPALPPTP